MVRPEQVQLVAGLGVMLIACFGPHQLFLSRLGLFVIGAALLTGWIPAQFIGMGLMAVGAIWHTVQKRRMLRQDRA